MLKQAHHATLDKKIDLDALMRKGTVAEVLKEIIKQFGSANNVITVLSKYDYLYSPEVISQLEEVTLNAKANNGFLTYQVAECLETALVRLAFEQGVLKMGSRELLPEVLSRFYPLEVADPRTCYPFEDKRQP